VILVDSDVLIANLRGIDSAHTWLTKARTEHGRLAVSAVTVAEITGGMRSPERREVNRLLSTLRTMPITGAISHRAGEFRRRYRRAHSSISIADYLIAATADLHGLPLATLNVRHFPMFDGLSAPFQWGHNLTIDTNAAPMVD
jgi:predicted nucleic acid-binding protein